MSPAGITCVGSAVMSKDRILGHLSVLGPGLGRNNGDRGGCGSVERTGTCPFSMPRETLEGLQRQEVQSEALLVQV